MGIEPMTNGLLDQRSTDWAMRPEYYRKPVTHLWSKNLANPSFDLGPLGYEPNALNLCANSLEPKSYHARGSNPRPID